MKASQLWSSLPAVILDYDPTTCKATVRPLIKLRYVDGSQRDFPPVGNVPVITPATAFAGIKLPVSEGDKVVLHIQDRDIQTLLFETNTGGVVSPEPSRCATARLHDLTDCVAYTGFGSFDGTIPSDDDVWIFNNRDSDQENHVRFKADGTIELKNLMTSITMTNEGLVTVEAPVGVTLNTPSTTLSGSLTVGGGVLVGGGVVATGDVLGAGISLSGHSHTGNLGAPVGPPM